VGVTGIEVLTTLVDSDFDVAVDVAFFSVTGLALTGVVFFVVTARRGRVGSLVGGTVSTALVEDVDVMIALFFEIVYTVYTDLKNKVNLLSISSLSFAKPALLL